MVFLLLVNITLCSELNLVIARVNQGKENCLSSEQDSKMKREKSSKAPP